MSFFNFGSAIPSETFCFYRKNIRNYILGVDAKGEGIIPGASGPLLSRVIWVVSFACSQALVDGLEVLKFLIVHAEEKCRDNPIHMAVRPPMLNRYNAECFAEVALQRHAMENGRIISSRVTRFIIER